MQRQLHAVSSLKAFIRIREVLADISHGRRAQERVHQRMQRHICITVSQKAFS